MQRCFKSHILRRHLWRANVAVSPPGIDPVYAESFTQWEARELSLVQFDLVDKIDT